MSRQFTRDVQREVSAGREGNAQRFGYAGRNNNIPVGIETHLWDLGGVYTQITNPLGVQLYASSTDPADNALMSALGIDNENDGRLTIRFFQLDGQNKVPLSGLMFRIFFHAPIGAGQFKGKIYVYEDDTVINGVPQTFSKIKNYSENEEQGTNGTFRVPNNATGYVDNYKSLRDVRKRFDIIDKFKEFDMTEFARLVFPTNPQELRFAPRFIISARTDNELVVLAKDNKSAMTFLVEGVLEFE